MPILFALFLQALYGAVDLLIVGKYALAQVIYEMMELREKYGTTIIFVTHSMGVASYMSDVIGVMQNGKLVEWGKTEDVISSPRQEYTRSLLDSVIELQDERLNR